MLYTAPALTFYIVFITAVTGLVMGSFLDCLAWRLAHGESIIRGRSHCAVCGRELAPIDLIPVISYIILRGRCRACGAKIPVRCLVTELICAAGYVSFVLRYDVTAEAVIYILMFSLLLSASLVDIDEGWIPDRLLIIGAAGFFILAPFTEAGFVVSSVKALIGAASLFFPMLLLVLAADRITGRDTMGGGDLKLFAMLGLYFGWQQGILLIIISCVTGIVFALASGITKRDTPFPFAPAISIAGWITALCGQWLIDWYVSLFL